MVCCETFCWACNRSCTDSKVDQFFEKNFETSCRTCNRDTRAHLHIHGYTHTHSHIKIKEKEKRKERKCCYNDAILKRGKLAMFCTDPISILSRTFSFDDRTREDRGTYEIGEVHCIM